MLIEIQIDKEKENLPNIDYMGKCSCGCGIELYSSMTVFRIPNMVYYGCLESYLNKNKVVL